MSISNLAIPKELKLTQKYIYDIMGFKLFNLEQESESEEYQAFRFQLDNLQFSFGLPKLRRPRRANLLLFGKELIKALLCLLMQAILSI